MKCPDSLHPFQLPFMASDKNWSQDDGQSKFMRKAKESPFVPIGKLRRNI